MAPLALHGLLETMDTAFGQARVLGQTPHTLLTMLTKTLANLQAFIPKSHGGRLAKG
jgi:hypothetical protein